MGYYMEQRGSAFFIDKNHFPKMIDAIHSLGNHPEKMGGGSYQGGKTISKHYSWVKMNFVESYDVKYIFDCWRWQTHFDDEGNITDISFDGEKMGDDRVLFDTIAPFVKEGSFIEMSGEDNDMWRWKFTNSICKEIGARIVWDE